MATGTAPNSGVPKHVLSKQIRLQGGPKLKAQDGYSEELCDLVAFTLVRDPKQRPSMDDILEHPYLRDTEDEYPKSLLVELIKRHDKWANAGGQRASLLQPYGAEAAEYREDPFIRGEWRFSTLESTEIMEGLGTEPLSNIEYVGNRIDPVADMTSTQAQEDSMNSYFAGETSHEVLEDFSNIEYTPGPSPRSHFDGLSAPAETVIPDEKRVRRGGHHLGALFDPNSSDYTSPALQKPTPKAKQDNSQRGPSDLPLRSQNASSTDLQRSDTETSSQGSLRSGKKIANIDTMRANRYARPTTMDWDFPQAAPAASSTLPSLPTLQSESSGASHANLNDWTPGYESDYAPSPSRPPLRNTETAPVPHDLTRGSRLDMDALLGDLGDTMPTYAYAPPQQPTFQEAGHIDTTEADDGSLDLDAMMGDLAPMNEPYHDTSDTQSSVYRGYETNDVVDTTATTPWRASIPAPPNAEAMAAGASDDVLGLELERFLGEWTSELGALGAQFAEFGVDDLSEDGEGKGSG